MEPRKSSDSDSRNTSVSDRVESEAVYEARKTDDSIPSSSSSSSQPRVSVCVVSSALCFNATLLASSYKTQWQRMFNIFNNAKILGCVKGQL